MSIERLSGGLTPADGSDARTFPEIFNGFADEFEDKNIPAFGTATPSDGDALVYNDAEGVYEPGEGGAGSLEDLTDTDITTPVAGEKLVYDGTEWVNLEGFIFVETVTFTSNGTFVKGDYPWLKAIRVRMVGGGGSAGSTDSCINTGVAAASSGGGGATYSESFITDIASLSSSVTVTVGAGGSTTPGGVTGSVDGSNGNDGGSSSFGAGEAYEVSAPGGIKGKRAFDFIGVIGAIGALNSDLGVGDVSIEGEGTETAFSMGSLVGDNRAAAFASAGGSSKIGSGGNAAPRLTTANSASFNGTRGKGYGAGGGGGNAASFDGTEADGGDGGPGSDGIVIVELFA